MIGIFTQQPTSGSRWGQESTSGKNMQNHHNYPTKATAFIICMIIFPEGLEENDIYNQQLKL